MPLDCAACAAGYTFSGPDCVNCKAGSARVEHCSACDATSAAVCGACEANYTLIGQSCVPKDLCKTSEENCQTCDSSNPSKCSTCSADFVLVHQGCISKDACKTTDTSCKTCSGDNPVECGQCLDNFVVIASICTDVSNNCKEFESSSKQCTQCEKSYFKDKLQCKKCREGCLTCSSVESCSECTQGLVLNGDICTSDYMSGGAIVGVTIGLILGLVVLGVAVYFVWRNRIKNHHGLNKSNAVEHGEMMLQVFREE
ncbi:Cysteine-rich membrane protein 2 [Spironucleus salmonicida]|uniref:Cysteine-rich membrane protein 2 n=1 Tax=Spironucleus salmonicida TaxID=348837 RepID=V6LLJ1_9EUKA|nr:Cysteine-rich membrane protein 2 [Spironucleus salmonicida]|eukprot:EST41564.1 Cysteine-rich membrane protein 2 [Spironucleus salmonicida]